MEKYITNLYLHLSNRWAKWKAQVQLWIQKYQYKLFFLGLLVLVVYTKDLQFTVGMDGDTIADFRALRPIPALVSQAFSVGGDLEEEVSISWEKILRGEKSGVEKEVQPATPEKKQAAEVVLPAPRNEKQRVQLAYVRRFAKVAQGEMEKYGIPASITLAQGLLESDAGKSDLSARHNNHFGIKCHSRKCPKGHCVNYADDTPKDFFRKYGTAWESFRAHSEFLKRDRYQSLYNLKPTDYKGWARGLEQAGYATASGYGEKLIQIVESLKLHQYDKR